MGLLEQSTNQANLLCIMGLFDFHELVLEGNLLAYASADDDRLATTADHSNNNNNNS